MIGSTISHYKILEKTGEGGMGVVYKAKDTKLNRIVALKLLPDHLKTNIEDKNRFIREARAVAALNHPNVCIIHEIQETGETPFIEMEYVDGHNLNELINLNSNNRLSIDQSICFAIQIGEALGEAHSKGIVHRDIKSENIMVNSKNQIKVMDFGLAKFKDATKLTNTSSMPGTLAYMAPEQMHSNNVDKRSDIYSLGVVLYEMLTGNVPFKADYEAQIMYSVLNESPIPIQEFLPDVSSELLHIVNRVLEKDPEDRYQSISDFVSELQRVKKHTCSNLNQSKGVQGSNSTHSITKTKMTYWNTVKQKFMIVFSILLFTIVLLMLILHFFVEPNELNNYSINFQNMEIKHLTTSRNVWEAAISSDGKYLAKVIFEGEKESIWLSHIETKSSVEITNKEIINYRGLHFSHDGNYLFYIKKYQNTEVGNLYKIPVLGGRAELILENIPEYISFSQKDLYIAYVKNKKELYLESLDGVNKKLILDCNGLNIEPSCPTWSPDGQNIAYINIKRGTEKIISIKSLNIKTLEIKNITITDWFTVSDLIWLSDGSGLIATASFQLFYVDCITGLISRITNDINTYGKTSLSDDGKALVTVQWQWISNIWVQDSKEMFEKISSSGMERDGCLGLTWSSDEKIIFCSYKNKKYDLWEMNPDGTDRRQLLFIEEFTYSPTISNLRNNYIVFVLRNKYGENIWRMDRNGSNLKQLTFGNTDDFPNLSPDEKWIIYNTRSIENGALMKISIDGGIPEVLLKGQEGNLSVSPSGKLVIYNFINENNQKKSGIMSINNGKVIKVFDHAWSIGWGQDDDHICYTDENILWLLSLKNGQREEVYQFEDNEWIPYYDWEPGENRKIIVRSKNIGDAVIITNFLN